MIPMTIFHYSKLSLLRDQFWEMMTFIPMIQISLSPTPYPFAAFFIFV